MSSTGQVLTLKAVGQGTAPFTAYYLNGQSTADIGVSYLPSCEAQRATGSNIKLINTDTNVVVGEHNRGFDQSGSVSSTSVEWDTVNHPTLNQSYTGLYKCISNVPGAMTAQQTFQLHVVGKQVIDVVIYFIALVVCTRTIFPYSSVHEN